MLDSNAARDAHSAASAPSASLGLAPDGATATLATTPVPTSPAHAVLLEDVDFGDNLSRPHVAPPFRITTPLKAAAWHDALARGGGLPRFQFIPDGILNGFDIGLPRATVDSFFACKGLRYKLYPNHSPANDYESVIDAMVEEEQREGRLSQFYDPEELFQLIGTFRNAPLTIAPKNGSYLNGRVCQDFSHPRDDPEDVSFNASVNLEDYVCDWGTFSQYYLLAADAPPGTEVAVFDVKSAHRRLPVRPWQQAYYVIHWRSKSALNHCCQFGGASSPGLWGQVADGFRCVFCHRFPDDDVLNWADDFTFWRYPLELGGFDLHKADIYALGDELGWPWNEKKTRHFSHAFPYIGFWWNLRERTVEVTEEKKDKYLRAADSWVRGEVFSRKEAQSLLGKLVHCTLVVPQGRSHVVALAKFAGSFQNDHARHHPNAAVFAEIDWWREKLGEHFCGMQIARVPDPSPTLLHVDASTTFGVGVVLDDVWDYWELLPGWDIDPAHKIGWAEMVAVELGLRAAIEAGANRLHLVVRSDNQGVVGALDNGKSRNLEANRVLRRIVATMMQSGIWLSTSWIPSAENLADPPSRGFPAEGRVRRKFAFSMPYVLREFVRQVA